MHKAIEFIRQFFGPTWKSAVSKWIVGTILFFIVTFIIAITSPDLAEWGYGWPLHFLEVRELSLDSVESTFNLLFLIIDILFWYSIVCLIHLLTRIKRLRDSIEKS